MQRRILLPVAFVMARLQPVSAQALNSFIGLANSAAAEISFINAAASASASSAASSAASSTSGSTSSSSTSASSTASSTAAAAVGNTGFTSSQLLAIIICSILFGLLAIFLIALALFCCLRSRRRQRNREIVTTTEDGSFSPRTEKQGFLGGLFRGRRNRRSATPVREKRGFRGPPDSDPLRENAPLTHGRHDHLAMTETSAIPLATTARPILAEHPAFRNQQNHENPFTPEPPPTRKAIGSNGHHALGDAALIGAAYGEHHHNENGYRGTSSTFRHSNGAMTTRNGSGYSNGHSPSRNHLPDTALVGGPSTYPDHHHGSHGSPATSHHGARDATIMSGAVAAEDVRHHRHNSRNRPYSEVRDDTTFAGGISPYNSTPHQNTSTSNGGVTRANDYDRNAPIRSDFDQRPNEHHGLRDTAIVGGGLAAAEGIHHERNVTEFQSSRQSDPFISRHDVPEDENNVPLATGGRYNRLYQNVYSNDSYVQPNGSDAIPNVETTGATGYDSHGHQQSEAGNNTIDGHLGDAAMMAPGHQHRETRTGVHQAPSNATYVEDVGAFAQPLPHESVQHAEAGNSTESSRYPRALNEAVFLAGTANATTHEGQYNRNALSANQRHHSFDATALDRDTTRPGLEGNRDPLHRQHLSSETNISRYSHSPSESPFSAATSRTTPGYDDQRNFANLPQSTEDSALLAGGVQGRRHGGNRVSSPFSNTNAVVNQGNDENSSISRGYTPKHAGRDAAMIGVRRSSEAEPTMDDRGSYSLTSSSSGGLNSHPVRRNRPPTPFDPSSTDSSSIEPTVLASLHGQPMNAAVFNPTTSHQSQEIILDSGSATSSPDHPYSGIGDAPTSMQLNELTHHYPSAELRHSLAGRPGSFHALGSESVDRPHYIESDVNQRGIYDTDFGPMANIPGAFPITPANEYQSATFAPGPHDQQVRHVRQVSLPRLDEQNLRPKPSPLDTNIKTPSLASSRSPNHRSFGFRDSSYDSRRGSATTGASGSGSGSGESWGTSITGQGGDSARASLSGISMPPRPWGTSRSGSPYDRASGIGLASTTDQAGPYRGAGEDYGSRTDILGTGVVRNERAETGALGRRMRSSDLSEAERERRFGSFESAL